VLLQRWLIKVAKAQREPEAPLARLQLNGVLQALSCVRDRGAAARDAVPVPVHDANVVSQEGLRLEMSLAARRTVAATQLGSDLGSDTECSRVRIDGLGAEERKRLASGAACRVRWMRIGCRVCGTVELVEWQLVRERERVAQQLPRALEIVLYRERLGREPHSLHERVGRASKQPLAHLLSCKRQERIGKAMKRWHVVLARKLQDGLVRHDGLVVETEHVLHESNLVRCIDCKGWWLEWRGSITCCCCCTTPESVKVSGIDTRGHTRTSNNGL